MDEPDTLSAKIVRPTLLTMDMYSQEAEYLVLATAMIERSRKTKKMAETGIFNICQSMHSDLWTNFLDYKSEVVRRLCHVANLDLRKIPLSERFKLVQNNDCYATAICRLIYFRVPKSIPVMSDKESLAMYWLTYFHSDKDAFASDIALIKEFKGFIGRAIESNPP